MGSAATHSPTSLDGVAAWRIAHHEMRIELDPTRTVVECTLDLVRTTDGDTLRVALDGRGLDTLRVALDGRELTPAEYELTDRALTLDLGAGVGGQRHRVTTTVAVRPGGPNDLGITASERVIASRVEPQGFRRITWSLDRPSNRSTFDVTLVADPARCRTLLANGPLTEQGVLDDGRVWARFHDTVPKPSYLFAVAAGDLDLRSTAFTTHSGRQLELRVAALPEHIDGAGFALDAMAVTMAYDEAHGGLEHDHDVLTFVAVPGYPDATEYQGLMFFDPALLVLDTAGWVDDDVMLVLLNVAHEYGHHTRGNRVTVRSWGQLTLKEGLTVLTAQNDVRRHLLGPASRVLEVLDLRRLQFPEEVTIGAPALRDEVDNPEQLYTRTTYLKGAEIFGMLRTVLGSERWLAVFSEFLRRFDLDAAGVDDFLAVASELAPDHAASIESVARWFTLRGRPSLAISVTEQPSAITVRRTDPLTDSPSVGIPLALGFRSTDGAPLAVAIDGGAPASEHVVVVDSREGTIHVDSPAPFVLAPTRGYSAPVDLSVDLDSDHLATLVVHDDDPYTRWWAAETTMIRAIDAYRTGDTDGADAEVALLADALRTVLAAPTDPLMLAQLLAVPDEFMLGDRDTQIDVDGVAAGLAFLRARLGAAVHDPLLAVLERHADPAPHGTAAADLNRRALVEPVLGLLLATGSDEALQIADRQLASADHTRAVRALAQLLHVDAVDADPLIERTYARWQHAPKLLDRWLRSQSGARRTDTIARVAALAAGPLYDRADRGRVMGVWFPFATRNRSVFHHPSGEGYRVFVDEVIELMPVNAGLVIRLVGDLLQFRRFDDRRQALLRAELERLADAPGMPDFAVGIVRGLLA